MILLLVILILLFGAGGGYGGYRAGWYDSPYGMGGGVIWVIVIIVLIFAVTGRL